MTLYYIIKCCERFHSLFVVKKCFCGGGVDYAFTPGKIPPSIYEPILLDSLRFTYCNGVLFSSLPLPPSFVSEKKRDWCVGTLKSLPVSPIQLYVTNVKENLSCSLWRPPPPSRDACPIHLGALGLRMRPRPGPRDDRARREWIV